MKTVVITGANRGIGLGFCHHYLIAGWQVIAISRTKPELKESKSFTKTHISKLIHIETDLNNEDSINAVINKLSVLEIKDLGIDLILNNAGIAEHQHFGQWSQAAFINSFTINAIAPALLIQTLSPLLANKAKVIQLTSGLASFDLNISPLAEFDSYSMSKVAVNMLSKRLSTKLSNKEILVCSISPGWVKTQMGGKEAPASVEQAVIDITNTIENLTISQSGSFFDELGNVLPW